MVLDYSFFKKKFLELTGFDLNCYKDQQMERRIHQFISRLNVKDYYGYYKILESDDQERARFLNYLTINTTSFFRDTAVYKNLKTKIIPEILFRKKNKIKFWSAGCSIGAEPYSLSIILSELTVPGRYFIIATDIDAQVLEKAEKGIYFSNQLENIDSQNLRKCFIKEGDHYKIREHLKNNIKFKKHDLLKDPYEKDCDLIMCRNVFIYFKQNIQEKILAGFIDSLNPLGYLVIGCSENVGNHRKFGLKRMEVAIYQKGEA